MQRLQNPAITPEAIIALPTFQGPWPDASGERLLYIERRFSPDTHSTSAQLCLLRSGSNHVQVLYDRGGIQTAFWLEPSHRILLFETTDTGSTSLSISTGAIASHESLLFVPVATLPSGVAGLAAIALSDDQAVVAFSALSTPDGKIFEAATAPKSWSSGREYDRLPVRTHDSWVTSQKLSVFCGLVNLEQPTLRLGEPLDVLHALDQEYKPFGGVHLTRHGIVVVAGPHLPEISEIPSATAYLLPMHAIMARDCSARQSIHAPNMHGFVSCPRISTDGKRMVFLQKRTGWLEDDAFLVVVCEWVGEATSFSVHEIYQDDAFSQLQSPQQVEIVNDDCLFFLAEHAGEARLFQTVLFSSSRLVSRSLTQGWSIDDFYILSSSPPNLLLAGSTVNITRRWATLDLSGSAEFSVIVEGTHEEHQLALNRTPYQSIQWHGADDWPVQAWLVKPRDFDATKTYPLLYFIHGGPNTAFNNAWPTDYWRNWNPVLFAEQGYVVIIPNASGSTGFGQEYARRVLNQWAGKPYIDHVRGFEFIKNSMPFVDTERAVALGLSYGGFMINWIQGQPLGQQFRALVSESGFVNNTAHYTADLIWFEDHFGGPMYSHREGYDKYNPIDHISQWSTPMLVIANELDHRVPMLEGLAAFQILQAKGVKSRFLSFADEGHIVSKPDNRLHWWRTVLKWCSEYTSVERVGE